MTPKIVMLNTSKLKPATFNPPDRVSHSRLKALLASIEEAKEILLPIIVVPENEHYTIIDGHRRFFAAKEIGMMKIPSIVRNDYEPAVLWRLLNQATKPITAAQWMQSYHLGYPEEHIPKHTKNLIKSLENVVDKQMFQSLCDRGRSPNIFSHARAVARYCISDDDETIRQVIEWFETHRQQFLARRFIGNGEPGSILLHHVQSNTPLKLKIT